VTLHSTRDGQKITIHGNTGVSLDVALGTSHPCPHLVMENGYANHVRITEDAQHVRWFHDQLGRHLDEADAERRAAAEAEEKAGDQAGDAE
jgi:hypothetical protein